MHLGDDAGQRAVGSVAPVHGQRVEHVPEDAGVGQHQHPAAAQVDAVRGEEAVEVGPDRAARVAEVVAGARTGRRAAARREPGQGVEVDQPQVAAVAEVAVRGAVPDVAHLDVVERGRRQEVGGPGGDLGHHVTPSAAAARSWRRGSKRRPSRARSSSVPDAVELLNGYFEFEPAEEVVVKERTVQGYRVLGLGPRRARIDDVEQLNLTPLVGRERELETLLELFADAKRGSGQVVGITGEPGVGKSRLVLEFCRQLDKDAISLIETRCVPYGTAVPFLPIRDAVRTAAGITDEDDRGSVLRKLEHALVAVGVDVGSALPSLFDLLGISIESGQRVEIDPATVKRRIFETVRLMLVSYSKQRPLVLVVEDLHWLDRTSEEFFTEFVDDVAARPMLLVSTYRPGYGAPLIGKSFVTQLALRSLIDADSMHLVRNLLTEPVAGDEVARTIVSRAEGNPLFLEELARAGARTRRGSCCRRRATDGSGDHRGTDRQS